MLFLFYIHVHNIHIHLQMNCPKKTPFLAPAIHGILHGHVWQTPQPRSEWRPQSAATQVVLHAFPGGSKGGFSSAGGDWRWLKWIQHDFNQWLVGGLELFLLFSIIYGIILPIDFHIFRGARSTARWNPAGFDCRKCATSQIWSIWGCETNRQVGFRPWRDSFFHQKEIPEIEMEQALFGFESAKKIQVWEVEL